MLFVCVVSVSVSLWSVLSCYIGLWLELGTDLGVRFGLSRVLSGPWRELRRRGVIDRVRSRLTKSFPNVDDHDHAALDDALRDLEPEFTWSGGQSCMDHRPNPESPA